MLELIERIQDELEELKQMLEEWEVRHGGIK